jgi:hypothetical protein
MRQSLSLGTELDAALLARRITGVWTLVPGGDLPTDYALKARSIPAQGKRGTSAALGYARPIVLPLSHPMGEGQG